MPVVPLPTRRGQQGEAWSGRETSGPVAETACEKLLIAGGLHLDGEIKASGCKNAAVALLPAAVLVPGASRFQAMPAVSDVAVLCTLLQSIGVVCLKDSSGGGLVVDSSAARPRETAAPLCRQLRASMYILGALLGRFGEADVPLPGGCDIGNRPVDQHLKGLRALGAEVRVSHGAVRARARRLRGASVYMDVTSVGATVNTILAAATAEGMTVIHNAAKEPHVVDTASFLNSCGARIQGAGTDVIRIYGVDPGSLRPATHSVVPDAIEAATYLIAGVATGGRVTVENVIPVHLAAVTAKLMEAGAGVTVRADSISVDARGRRPKAVNVTTLPYPGFPTDVQQPMSALLAVADGTSIVTETVWDGRFKHASELARMGARLRIDGRTAVIEGVPELLAAPVRASDLRAGAALVVAALTARGVTELSGLEHLDRGYEAVPAKLSALGARVARV